MALRSVLIVTYHFPPSSASGSFRMLGFARHLPRHGWRGVVVAPPSLPWEPVDEGLLTRVPAETSVYQVPYLRSKVARKLAPIAGWLPRAARACGRAVREQKPDAVLTSGPPHEVHWLGLWLKTRYGLPWVADFRDPWYPAGRLERGNDLASRWVGAQESAVMNGADAVIANAPNACKALRDAYPRLRSRFVTLPNGYDRETFETLTAGAKTRSGDGPIRVVHTGAIYAGRDPRPLLDAVAMLANGDGASPLDLELNFFGPEPESDLNLAGEAGSRGLGGRVVSHGQVPYARALRAMADADVLLLLDSPGRTVGVPAKLYEYIGAGRPILAMGERGGDLGQVLEQSGVPYRIAPPDDPAAIAGALAELSREASAVAKPRRDPHRFSREALAGRLASLLDRAAGLKGRRDRTPAGDGDGAGEHDPAGTPASCVEC